MMTVSKVVFLLLAIFIIVVLLSEPFYTFQSRFLKNLPHFNEYDYKWYSFLIRKRKINVLLCWFYFVICIFMYIASFGGYLVGIFRRKIDTEKDENEFKKENIKIFITIIVITIFLIIPLILFLLNIFNK